jgi:hypothetical protein
VSHAGGNTTITLTSAQGIAAGAKFYTSGDVTEFTVINVSTSTNSVVTQLSADPVIGTVINFVNPKFTSQSTILNFKESAPASVMSASAELRGQVHADQNTAFITFADAAVGSINKIQISGDQSGNPRFLGSESTATTGVLTDRSAAIATNEFVWNIIDSPTTTVAYAQTATTAILATTAETATTATTALTMPVGKNGYGSRTVSTSPPSGGTDGDIWYQIL